MSFAFFFDPENKLKGISCITSLNKYFTDMFAFVGVVVVVVPL